MAQQHPTTATALWLSDTTAEPANPASGCLASKLLTLSFSQCLLLEFLLKTKPFFPCLDWNWNIFHHQKEFPSLTLFPSLKRSTSILPFAFMDSLKTQYKLTSPSSLLISWTFPTQYKLTSPSFPLVSWTLPKHNINWHLRPLYLFHGLSQDTI